MVALKHVVIVGGGTAGWLTAGILAADHRASANDGLKVTLIESPTIPTLGVGEGTWPSLRDTLQRIGLSEYDFIRRCSASFKQGSRFDGWVDGSDDDTYSHPFDAPPSEDDVDALSLWGVADREPFSSVVCSQAKLCQAGRAPKQSQTPEYAAVANYAYHLDAVALADMLREHCTKQLGVTYIVDDVIDVTLGKDGSVSTVTAHESGEISADVFVDCTGKRALLIGECMTSPLTDVSGTLFNDRALAIHVSYASPDQAIPSQTHATAQEAGWIWDIALQTRRGIGYTYSSRHSDEEHARVVLEAYLERTSTDGKYDLSEARLLKFESAYRAKPWVKNVVAIGMSQGFVEPLEASAIVMVELSAAMLSDTLPPDTAQIGSSASRFNQRFSYRWERIVDFLKLHYVLSRRDEPYWQEHRVENTWPPRLKELLQRWKGMPPSREDFPQASEIFPAASYAFVLYGMGFETLKRPLARRKDVRDRALMRRDEISQRTQRMLSGLPTNRQLLDHISGQALSRVS